MSFRELTPASLRAPFGAYAHGIEVPPGWRLVRTSGQLGIGADDEIPNDARAQADLCFDAIGKILAAAEMGVSDVAHISAWVTDRAHMEPYMAARDAFMAPANHLPASTLVIVSGFTRPEFKVEIEVMAAAK